MNLLGKLENIEGKILGIITLIVSGIGLFITIDQAAILENVTIIWQSVVSVIGAIIAIVNMASGNSEPITKGLSELADRFFGNWKTTVTGLVATLAGIAAIFGWIPVGSEGGIVDNTAIIMTSIGAVLTAINGIIQFFKKDPA